MNPQRFNKLLLAGLLLLAFGLPLVVRSATYMHILVLLLFYAYLTTSWNIVGGFAGVLPLGHAAFVGIGAASVHGSACWSAGCWRQLPGSSSACQP